MMPKAIQDFSSLFAKLPSVGPRLAMRLAFYFARMPDANKIEIVKALQNLSNIDQCPMCLTLKERNTKLCGTCRDTARDASKLMIIEKETDLYSLEKYKLFNGLYFLLGALPARGALSEIHKERMQLLLKRLQSSENKVREIIVGLPRNTEGYYMHEIIRKFLQETTVKITRLGGGLPSGGEVEFADEETLREALQGRS